MLTFWTNVLIVVAVVVSWSGTQGAEEGTSKQWGNQFISYWKSAKCLISSKVDQIFQRSCSIEEEPSMTEIVIYKAAILLSLDQYIPIDIFTDPNSCSFSPQKSFSDYWQLYLKSETGGTCIEKMRIECVLALCRSVARMVVCDWERVAYYGFERIAVTMELIKFTLVCLVGYIFHAIVSRIPVFKTGAVAQNAFSAASQRVGRSQRKDISHENELSENVLGRGDTSDRSEYTYQHDEDYFGHVQ